MGAPRDSTALTLARRRPSIQDMAPGKRSLPGQGRQGPGKRSLPGRPSPYKAIQGRSIQDKRSRPRQVELAGKGRSRLRTASQKTRPGRARGPASFRARRAPCPDKIKTPARHLPGELRCVPALQLTRPRVALGAIPGTRGGWLCSLGATVALLGGGAFAVANGDAVTDAFGVDGDGH